MSLKQRIEEEMKKAMKARDDVSLSAIRLLRSAILNREIELGVPADDAEVIRLVEKGLKQRRESAGLYRQGGRTDLAEREEQEARVLESYLPARLSAEDLEKLVDEALAETGAKTPKEMGAAMKAASAKVAGRADNKTLSELIRRKLANG